MTSLRGLHLRSRLQRYLLTARLRAIRLLVCDVDGVLTDGGLHYDEDGRVIKRFDVRDGLAIRMLQDAGISVALLSGGRSGAIEFRARDLLITHCITGVCDKRMHLEQLRKEFGMPQEATAFIGDDLNDLCVKSVTGLLISPANGARGLTRSADWVLQSRGGYGAVRELSEALLESQGHMNNFRRNGWHSVNT